MISCTAQGSPHPPRDGTMRWHFFFLAAYVIIAATDANPTSATLKSPDHMMSAHVPSQAATQANPTSEAHGTKDHLNPNPVVAQAITQANPTSEAHDTKDHLNPNPVVAQATTQANPTSEAHGTKDHLNPNPVVAQATTQANPTSEAHDTKDHLNPNPVVAQATTQANPTSKAHGTKDHLNPNPVVAQVIPPEVPTDIPKAHGKEETISRGIQEETEHEIREQQMWRRLTATHANPTSEAHGRTDRLTPTHGSSQVIGSLSKPTLHYNFLGSTMHITCFSKSGTLPIRYQLFLNDSKEQEKTVLKAEPANFTISATPGTKFRLNCNAISQTDGKSSSEEAWVAVDPDDSPTDDTETEQGKDGPEYLIPLQHILTSLTPAAIETNKLVLIICGSFLLAFFIIFIIITYLRGQKEQKKGDLPVDERPDLLLYPNLVYYQKLLCYQRMPQIPLKKPLKGETNIF